MVCKTHQKAIRSNTYNFVPRDEWEVIEDCHEAIITKEHFERVQKLIDRRPAIIQERTCPFYNLFHGLMQCETCGKSLQLEKRYSVYYELKSINDFLNGYYATCESAIDFLPLENLNDLSPELRKAIYYKSLWEGEIQSNLYSTYDDIGSILKQQSQIVGSLGLVYHGRGILQRFFKYLYCYGTAICAGYYVAFSDFDKNYDRFDLSNILKKMEQQLRF